MSLQESHNIDENKPAMGGGVRPAASEWFVFGPTAQEHFWASSPCYPVGLLYSRSLRDPGPARVHAQGTASLGVRSGGFFLRLLNAQDGED